MMYKKLAFLIFFVLSNPINIFANGIVICTVADELYFDPLINLIGSIHKVNFDDLEEICVYNLGLNQNQIEKINSMEKVKLYEIEKVNPKLLKPVIIDVHGKSVRGWYAWKPVIIKQTLDKFPAMIYLDAGNTVLQPLNNLFKHIEQNGYFFLSAVHNIRDWTTKRVCNYFNLETNNKFILDDKSRSISANIIGLTKNYYDNLVMPMYNHAKDFYLFEDDGSGPYGFGKFRHDQTLFSIYVHLLNLNITNQDFSLLKVDNKRKIFHTHYYAHMVSPSTVIYQSRWDLTFAGKKTNNDEPYFCQFIKYRNNNTR